MRAYWAELREEFRGPKTLVVWAGLTTLLTVGGPLGTLHSCTFQHRFLFWSVVVIGMILLTTMVSAGINRLVRRPLMRRDVALVAGIVSLVLTLPIRSFAAGSGDLSVGIVTSRPTETLAFLFLTAMALSGFRHLMRMPDHVVIDRIGAGGTMAVETEAKPAQELPRVVTRLEPRLQGELLALTGRDHYVDVLTRAGRGSILMRFSDAMSEAGMVPGTQIHRSHWVAWSAIDGVEREGAKVFVRVADERFPVSRSFRNALAARGLL
jgi:hypothetical protein